MKFHTFGNDDGKTILLIHGMLNPWQIWKDVSDAFADHMNEQSVKNAFNSVFSKFEFRKYDASCNILFMHGTKGNESVLKKAAIKMKEVNPQTEIRCFEGYAHAQLLSFETLKWIKEVKDFLGRKWLNHKFCVMARS